MRIRPSVSSIVVLISLCGVLLLIYWPGLQGPFLLDDLQTLSPLNIPHYTWNTFFELALTNQTGPLGRPISILSFLINEMLFGHSPYYFKLINLVIHLLCSASVGLLIYFLLRLVPLKRTFAFPTALLTTLLWSLHPLHSSSVLYIVQRMTILSALFMLIGIVVYLYARCRQITQRSYLPFMGTSFMIFFPLACLSKESGFLFVWYLFCIEYFILHFACPTKQQQYYLTHFHRILSLLVLLAILTLYYFNLSFYFSVFHEKDLSLIARLLTESRVVLYYIALIFRPTLAQMGLYHDDFPVSYSLDESTLLSLTLLCFMVAIIVVCRRKSPIVSFGLAWFLISHAIESTILPLELVFEHRNYMASIGLLLIPSYYISIALIRTRSAVQSMLVFSSAATILLLLSLTFLRNLGWSSTDRFLEEAQVYHPESARTHIELGNVYFERHHYQRGIEELDKAYRLQPQNVGILLHQILVGCRTGIIEKSLYLQSEHKIKHTAITPYTLMVLNQLVKNLLDKQCSALDATALYNIIEGALKNPFLQYRPLYQAVLYQLNAGIALYHQNITLCGDLLLLSFESYPSRLDPLIQKAYIEWNAKKYDDAKITLRMIQQHASRFKAPHDTIATLQHLMNRGFDEN